MARIGRDVEIEENEASTDPVCACRPHRSRLHPNPQTNRELQCAGGVLGGAAVGGLLGNQIGGGTGKRVATAVGAGAGAAVGTQNPACK